MQYESHVIVTFEVKRHLLLPTITKSICGGRTEDSVNKAAEGLEKSIRRREGEPNDVKM